MPTVLQVNLTSWSATLSTGDEAAPYVEVSSGSAGSGTVDYGGYGPAAEATSNGQKVSDSYLVSVPISSASQYVYFNVSLNAAESSGLVTLLSVASTKVDLVGLQSSKTLSASAGSSSLSGTYRVLRLPEVANTLLWTPANNTTLSSVPWGVKRYVAEPDFDLLVVNASAKVTVSSVEWASGGADYSVTLQRGLNNILVPRGAFLSSLLGQALINNTNDTSVKVPTGSGVTFTGSDWSGRTETSNSNPTGNVSYIWVFSTPNQSESNTTNHSAFGGLPSDPSVEAGNESRQVQAVYWVDITKTGSTWNGRYASEAAELDDLIGGLVVNRSGNLTGNLLNVTAEVPTLGLPANVHTALANATVPSGGIYSAPKYQEPAPSTPQWNTIAGIVWNTVTGLATKAISAVWNFSLAASAYLGQAVETLSNRLGLQRLASQAWAGVKSGLGGVAQAMTGAFQQLLQFIYRLVKQELELIVDPITQTMSGYDQTLSGSMNGSATDVANGHSVTLSHATSLTDALGGSVMMIALGIGAGLSVVFTLLTPFDLAADFVLPIILSLIVVGSILAFSRPSGDAYLNSEGVWALDAFVNRTVTANTASTPQVDWKALAESVALAATVTDIPTSIWLGVNEAESPDAALLWPTIALVFDMVALTIAAVAWASHTVGTIVVALVASGVGFLVSTIAVSQAEDTSMRPLVALDLGLGITALGAALYDAAVTFE